MLNMESLYADENTLSLKDPTNFQNTMRVEGSSYVLNSWCKDLPDGLVYVEHKPSYFSGYVFRADKRKPTVIFESGFQMRTPTLEGADLFQALSGAREGGLTRAHGISTTICASATNNYVSHWVSYFGGINLFSGYVYLIDAVDFKGFAIPSPRPRDPIAMWFPHLLDVYEVNFPNPIPNFKVVGVVYPPETGSGYFCDDPWPDDPSELSLAVNPYYTASFGHGERHFEGIEAASMVADRFNGTDWVLV